MGFVEKVSCTTAALAAYHTLSMLKHKISGKIVFQCTEQTGNI